MIEMAGHSLREPVAERARRRLAHVDENGWFFAAIAKSVAERRRELRLSQQELARRCGTTQSAIARLEAGGRPPRIDTLLRIAAALDCKLRVELSPAEGPSEAASPSGNARSRRPLCALAPRGLRG